MSAQCDPGDCGQPCTHCGGEGLVETRKLGSRVASYESCAFCGPDDPCTPHDCVYVATPRLSDAEAIARIMVAGRGAEEHKRRWQNGFISEAAYQATVKAAMDEIERVMREPGR